MSGKYVKTVDLHMWVDPDVYSKMRQKADELDLGVSTWARMIIKEALRDEPSNSARSASDATSQEAPHDEPPR